MDTQLKRAVNSMHEALVYSAVLEKAIENLAKADETIVKRISKLRSNWEEVYFRLVSMQTDLTKWPYVDGRKVHDEQEATEKVEDELSVLYEDRKDLELRTVEMIETKIGIDGMKRKNDAKLAIATARIENRLGPIFSQHQQNPQQNQNQHFTRTYK